MLNPKINVNDSSSLTASELVSVDDVCRVVGMPKVVPTVVDGKVVNQVVFEELPPEKMNEGLKADDFALENLLSAGANLNRVDYSDSSLKSTDVLVENVSKLNVHVKSQKTE